MHRVERLTPSTSSGDDRIVGDEPQGWKCSPVGPLATSASTSLRAHSPSRTMWVARSRRRHGQPPPHGGEGLPHPM